MLVTKAWHLRQDGKAFPVVVHMYCMGDEDLSSEAEVASFIIKSDSKDKDLACEILDAWMAMLIEQDVSYDADSEGIDSAILRALNHLPYKFPYALSNSEYLDIHHRCGNYDDVDSLYDFIDEVRDNIEKLQDDIKKSLNQQFCRVRYGGQYNSLAGNNEIWFRVSSVGYNWANTIYLFANSIKRSHKLTHITICRDSESDDASVDYFYKAKDGALYKNMPIDEYFNEEHEHSVVFESINMNEGVIRTLERLLHSGSTYDESIRFLTKEGVSYQRDLWKYLVNKSQSRDCIKDSVLRRRTCPV